MRHLACRGRIPRLLLGLVVLAALPALLHLGPAGAATPPLPCGAPLVDRTIGAPGARMGSGTGCTTPVYTIQGPLTVAGGATLTIDPGVALVFEPDATNQPGKLLVNGALQASGKQSHPIVFSTANSAQPPSDDTPCSDPVTPSTWAGIEVAGGAKATLQQAGVSWARNGLAADENSNVTVQAVRFFDNYCTGLRLSLGSKSQAKLDANRFSDNTIGLAVTEATGGPAVKLTKAVFEHNGRGAADGYGLLVGGVAEVDADGAYFSNNGTGAAAITDSSRAGAGFARPAAGPAPTTATLKLTKSELDDNSIGVQAGAAPDSTNHLPASSGIVSISGSSFAGAFTNGVLAAGLAKATIAGSTFSDVSTAVHAQDQATLSLTGSQLRNAQNASVEILGTSAATLSQVQIAGGFFGVSLQDSATLSMDKSTIADGSETGLVAESVPLSHDVTSVIVTNTQISGFPYGVQLFEQATGSFDKLAVTNTFTGLSVVSTGDTTVTNSTFTHSATGVLHQRGKLTMHTSAFLGNFEGLATFADDPSLPPQFSGDALTFSLNTIGVLVPDSYIYDSKTSSIIYIPSTVHLHGSNIAGNYQAGLRSDNHDNSRNQAAVDATDNWWGAASGPTISSNAAGTGDRIIGTSAGVVDFSHPAPSPFPLKVQVTAPSGPSAPMAPAASDAADAAPPAPATPPRPPRSSRHP